MPTSTPTARLRQCALAVSVLDDLDLLPRGDGVLVTGTGGAGTGLGEVLVGWTELAEALGDHDPLSASGRRRVGTLLHLYRMVADHGEHPDGAPALIRRAARALALPPDLRERLATGEGTGLRAVAVPTRRRGWFDLRQVDPAYVAAVWSLTGPPERGLPTPLLVARHEVVAPTARGVVTPPPA